MTDHPAPGSEPDHPLQQVQHASATARVPDQVGRGVFATGVIVLRGPNEYALDFVQSLARPSRVAARVILPPQVASQFVIALEQAIDTYTAMFGHPPQEPRPPQPVAQAAPAAGGVDRPVAAAPASGPGEPVAREAAARPVVPQPPLIAEVYDSLKLPDEMLGGVYANVASITHTTSEFCFDFIAQLFPRSAVTARVYMAAPRVPELLGSLKRSISGR